jgi:cell division protein FtsN
MPRRQLSFLNILTMATILASVIVILTEFGSMISAQGQVNASSLTPEQKDAICNPNNPASKLNPVNTTESRICGIPVTVKPHPSNATTTSGTNMTTGGEAPPST